MAAGQRLRQHDPREHLIAIDPQRLHRAVRRAVTNLHAIEQPVQGIGLEHMATDRRLQSGQRFRRFAGHLGPNRFPLAAHRLRLALENAECQPMFVQAVDADFHFDRVAALRFDGHGLRPHQVAQGQDAGRRRFAQRAADRLPRHFKVGDARQDLVAMDPVIPQEKLVPAEYRDKFLLRQLRNVGMQQRVHPPLAPMPGLVGEVRRTGNPGPFAGKRVARQTDPPDLAPRWPHCHPVEREPLDPQLQQLVVFAFAGPGGQGGRHVLIMGQHRHGRLVVFHPADVDAVQGAGLFGLSGQSLDASRQPLLQFADRAGAEGQAAFHRLPPLLQREGQIRQPRPRAPGLGPMQALL